MGLVQIIESERHWTEDDGTQWYVVARNGNVYGSLRDGDSFWQSLDLLYGISGYGAWIFLNSWYQNMPAPIFDPSLLLSVEVEEWQVETWTGAGDATFIIPFAQEENVTITVGDLVEQTYGEDYSGWYLRSGIDTSVVMHAGYVEVTIFASYIETLRDGGHIFRIGYSSEVTSGMIIGGGAGSLFLILLVDRS
jgi:hypothetical protein